jgi:hypothetical protein
MKMQNTNEMDFEYPLNPKTLRENAELICDAVESNSTVILFKCEGCGRLHMNIVSEEDDTFQTNTIH